jgi:hypothetical protein
MPSVDAIVKTTYRRSADIPGDERSNEAAEAVWAVAETAEPGPVIVNVTVLELDPPDAALEMETSAVPGVVTSVAEIWALAWVVPVTAVGVRGEPFQKMTDPLDPLTKPVPVTVRVKAALPAATLGGESGGVMTGGGG